MGFIGDNWPVVLLVVLAVVGVALAAYFIHRADKKRDSLVILVNAVVVLSLLAIGPAVALATAQDPNEDLCTPTRGGGDSPTPKVSPQATVTLADEEAPVLNVGHDINAGPLTIAITLDRKVPNPRTLKVASPVLTPMERGGAELDRRQVKVWATLDGSRRSGYVVLCFPPESRLDGPSGSFSGQILLTDPRLERTAIPVTVNLSYPKRDRVVFAGLAVCLLASFYVYFLRRPDLDEDAAPDDLAMLRVDFSFLLGYWRFATSAIGVITIAAGLIGAAGAFSVQYLTSDTWAGAWTDWFAYAGAIGTAYIAAGTAGRLAQNIYDPAAAAARRERRVRRAARKEEKKNQAAQAPSTSGGSQGSGERTQDE